MTEIKLQPVRSADDLRLSRELREAVLRRPWQQPLEAETQPPADDLLLLEGTNALASGRLSLEDGGRVARLRGMAVAPDRRGQGLGTRMLQALLARARGRGCASVVCNARSEALGLYRRAGFEDIGPGPLLFGKIPHRRLQLTLRHTDFSPWALRLSEARSTQRGEIEDLIFGVLAEYGMQPERDGIDRDLVDVEHSYRNGGFWVLRDDRGTLVATVALYPLEGKVLELRRMYLRAALRGSGLGRALLGLALHRARALGAPHLELETASVLKEARALYQWAGFKPCPGHLAASRCDQRMQMRL